MRFSRFILLFVVFLISCKKDWVCECKNSNGSYTAGYIEDTKRKAKKNCTDLSQGDTQCNIK